MSSDDLAKHIDHITVAFNVQVIPKDSAAQTSFSFSGARAGGRNEIHIDPVTDERTYAIALHELGHCLHPSGSVRSPDTGDNIDLKLLEEESAWEWAHRMALVWTPAMTAAEKHGMDSYLLERRRRTLPRLRESMSDFMRRRR